MQLEEFIPVSKIKIRVPHRRRELISRTRLIESIYEQLEKQLLLVVAPAGYGKTSLLVDLAHDSELPVCWLSLDALDQEPQRFLAYLISAIAEKFPDFGRDSINALKSMTSFEQDGERVLVTLTNDIALHIDEHFILILDDYHLVGDILIVRQLINRFLQLVGENAHLILAARHLPDFPDMPLLTVRNQIGGLSFEELAFLPDEIQQLFSQNNNLTLSPQDATKIVEETEGWIAAISLTGGQPGSLPQMHPLRSTRELFDFFSREVLARQGDQLRRFLLMTSLFDAFDIALCEEVLDPLMEGEKFDWSSLFSEVQTGSLFSVPLDDEGRWMRYHHLFGHFLKSQLQFEQPALAWHIQQNLARTYENRGAWEEVLYVYSTLEDQANAARVLVKAGPSLIRQGRILTLASWLDHLPRDLVDSQPALLSLHGVIQDTKGDNRFAIELYDRAEKLLRAKNNTDELASLLNRRAAAYRQLGNYDQALLDAEEALSLTSMREDAIMHDINAEAQRLKGQSLFGLGRLHESIKWLESALSSFQALGTNDNILFGIKDSIPILETELGVAYRRLGKLDVAANYYTRALRSWEHSGNSGWKAHVLNNLAILHQTTGKIEEAFTCLDQALQIAEQTGYSRIQALVLISIGDILTEVNDLDSAQTYYERALTIATHLGHSAYILYASLGEARLVRLGGDPVRALHDLEMVKISQSHLGPYERALLSLEKGRCLLESGQLKLALDALQDASGLLLQGEYHIEQRVAELWLIAAIAQREPVEANKKLNEIIQDERNWLTPTPFMLNAGHALKWLKNIKLSSQSDPAMEQFLEGAGQIKRRIPIWRNAIRQSAQHVALSLPELGIVTFGDVKVYCNNKMLLLSDWQTREARDLFFFLLHSPPLTKEQIALELWPDISPARLKMRFKINIHRIRRAVGQDAVIFEGERYRFNREINYSWDREKLDEVLQSARRGISLPEKKTLLERAIEIANGPYLADIDGDWAVPEQLKYQDICQQMLLELGEIYLAEGQVQAGLNVARRILQSDALLEAAHRLIIQAYAALHDPAGMARQYQQYQKALADQLGLQPSSEIVSLYEQLLNEI
ncbi:MAG: tetratricopeptide repeat protein [Anaerolineales bacterium]|nr:tetratricopeptide repeat protein [Anaerolineales bacterium]